MPETLLYDVNLQTCPDAWLHGHWRQRRRGPGADTVFSRAEEWQLYPTGVLQLLGTAGQHAGGWQVERDARLGRPYLTLVLPQEQSRALITRLQRAPDGRAAAITLYLANGVELVLDYVSSPESGRP
ncbi:hypothetical protein GCM10022408_02430 [Hymenobacter fastidiosus]|uniref:Uncharacterized protein n=1 Tax=Hymenobacter fastidiosus TaxID=486264 RepID=A0ABP7RCK2_9BACT